MMPRVLPRSRLGNLIPTLVDSQALVALVAATGDLRWAAEAAWDVARAAAHAGRRVALVDLWIEEPRLHEVVGFTPSDGIVDAFEYGVSLTKTAHEVNGVFFIAAGSYTASAGEIFGHARWKKLQAGFRSEGALLLLYLSAGGLARLAAAPDGLLVLSPDGFEPQSSIGQGIIAATERGVPMLGVVREHWAPPPAPAVAKHIRPGHPPAGAPRRRAARPVLVAATLAAGAVGGWGLLTLDPDHPPFAAGRAILRPPPLPPPPPPPRADTLAWTVQLAAYGSLQKALALADRLREEGGDGVGSFVTIVPLGRGTVWYRVLVGSYPTRDSAAAARVALWRRRAVPPGQGELLRAPYSLALAGTMDLDSLRRRGIPALPGTKHTPTLVGAFESPEQASVAQAQLARAGIPAKLITRVETTP
jgi:cell division septation protein DedD